MNIAPILLMAILPLVSPLTFSIDPEEEKLFTVSHKFVSANYDCSNIETRFAGFNTSDPFLIKLLSHLAPMYFRIGGTYADRIYFTEDEENLESDKPKGAVDSIPFYASDWLRLYQFAKAAGRVYPIFDLNSLMMRNSNGSWNSENAEKMIEFSFKNNMSVDWQLGNEPDLYWSLFAAEVKPEQLAQDYQKLSAILSKYDLYNSSHLVGIDMFDVAASDNSKNYLKTFLQGAADALHAVTWHQYYFPGGTATPEDYLNVKTFSYLKEKTDTLNDIVKNYGAGNELWLGETADAYNGGTANMTNRYIGTFLWLDKLGLGAQLGIYAIFRQTFFHDYYALIDDNYVPNPDWWINVLHKRIIDRTVLNITNDGSEDSKVRLYAHCAKRSTLWNDTAVVVFGFNIDSEAATVKLDGFSSDSKYYSYELTSSDDTLFSQFMNLNGVTLKVSSEGDLPNLDPKVLDNSGEFSIPGYGIVFWVFDNTNVATCA